MIEGFNSFWPTIILKDTITDKLLLDDITNYTLIKYGQDNKVSADIKDENLLVFHFLKSRNGTTRIGFYSLDRSTMRFIELDSPPASEIVNNKV